MTGATRAALSRAIRFEHFIVDSIARGVTDMVVGSGALLGIFSPKTTRGLRHQQYVDNRQHDRDANDLSPCCRRKLLAEQSESGRRNKREMAAQTKNDENMRTVLRTGYPDEHLAHR